MVRVCVLATSSAGNCTFLSAGRTRILIDAGLSRKDTFQRLEAIGEDPAKLDAILITHEHSDHVSGLPVIAKALKAPYYISGLTAPAIDWGGADPRVERFQAGTAFAIGDIQVNSFTVPHDAVDPVGFTFLAEGVKIGLAMDLGYLPDSVKFHLRGSHWLLLESNHDLEMLKVGPYPWAVKQRVMGRKGHLSNDVVSEYIRADLDADMQTLVLGHLSEHNNHPEIVRMVATAALKERQARTKLIVAAPRKQSEVFQF